MSFGCLLSDAFFCCYFACLSHARVVSLFRVCSVCVGVCRIMCTQYWHIPTRRCPQCLHTEPFRGASHLDTRFFWGWCVSVSRDPVFDSPARFSKKRFPGDRRVGIRWAAMDAPANVLTEAMVLSKSKVRWRRRVVVGGGSPSLRPVPHPRVRPRQPLSPPLALRRRSDWRK